MPKSQKGPVAYLLCVPVESKEIKPEPKPESSDDEYEAKEVADPVETEELDSDDCKCLEIGVLFKSQKQFERLEEEEFEPLKPAFAYCLPPGYIVGDEIIMGDELPLDDEDIIVDLSFASESEKKGAKTITGFVTRKVLKEENIKKYDDDYQEECE